MSLSGEIVFQRLRSGKRKGKMPKDPSSRSLLSPKSRGTLCRPYPSNGRGVSQGSSSKDGEECSRKDWEESTCPICMEYPHNAVLLMCSSHDKGCRPYMCDTSYRHSNCLDQYRRAKTSNDKNSERDPEASLESVAGVPVDVRALEMAENMQENGLFGASSFRSVVPARGEEGAGPMVTMHGRLAERAAVVGAGDLVRGLSVLPGMDRASNAEFLDDPAVSLSGGDMGLGDDEGRGQGNSVGDDPSSVDMSDLLCPLCRGKVYTWKVVEPARHQLNRKPRGCAQEACSFTGTYKELREHARAVHPLARPSDIDPARQRDWRRLERQRDLGDVLSTIRSAMPRATVLGDYVIDDDEEDHEDEGDDSDFPGDDGNWWTVFLLFQVFGPSPTLAGRGIPGRMSRMRGPSGSPLMRGGPLWGEPLQGTGLGSGVNNLNGSNVNVEGSLGSSTSRRRRSRPRSRGDL